MKITLLLPIDPIDRAYVRQLSEMINSEFNPSRIWDFQKLRL